MFDKHLVIICPTAEQSVRLLLGGKNPNGIDAKDTGAIMDCSGCTRIRVEQDEVKR